MPHRSNAHQIAARWLRTSMTLEEAKDVLGFPPGYVPTNTEINKAWRARAKENHPDRGGSPDAMVEVNVAKEVLEGKRTNDRTEVGAEKKQRAVDMAAIEQAKVRAEASLNRVNTDIRGHLFRPWRIDLREFVLDYSESVDQLQDYVEDVKTENPKRAKRFNLIRANTRETLVQVARVSAKLKALQKLTVEMRPTAAHIEQVCREVQKFKPQVALLSKTTGNLVTLIMTIIDDEDDEKFGPIVPEKFDDPIGDGHRKIMSFLEDYRNVSPDCDATKVGREVESAVSEVLAILQRRGSATSSLPAWDQWDASTFEHAATLIDRRTNASRRVAARYLAPV